MDQARRRKRAAAGRSGGIFQLSKDASGIPVYQYLVGYGSIVSSTITVEDNVCYRLDSSVQDEKSTDHSDRSSKNDSSCISSCPIVTTNEGSSRSKDCRVDHGTSAIAIPDPEKETLSTRDTHTHSYVRSPVVNIPQSRAFDDDFVHNSKNRMNQARPDEPPSFGASTASHCSQFEDGYFSTREEYLHATSLYQHECSSSGTDEESVIEESDSEKPPNSPRDMRNHYEVLGLAMQSNDKMITLRARHLMSVLHPDKVSHRTIEQRSIDGEEFARVSLAKTELLDVELRMLHDSEIIAGTWVGVPYN